MTEFPLPGGVTQSRKNSGDVKEVACRRHRMNRRAMSLAALPRRRLSDRFRPKDRCEGKPARSRGRGPPAKQPEYRLAREILPAANRRRISAYRALLSERHRRVVQSCGRARRPAAVWRWQWHWRFAHAGRISGPRESIAVAPFNRPDAVRRPACASSNGDDPAANRDLLQLQGASYFSGHEPNDPLVSPLFGDITGCSAFVTATAGRSAGLRTPTRAGRSARRRPASTYAAAGRGSVQVYRFFHSCRKTRQPRWRKCRPGRGEDCAATTQGPQAAE